MVSVHTMVTVQDFNGLEHGDYRRMSFCVHTQEGEGLVERHVHLFEVKTCSPGTSGQVHKLRTCMPDEEKEKAE